MRLSSVFTQFLEKADALQFRREDSQPSFPWLRRWLHSFLAVQLPAFCAACGRAGFMSKRLRNSADSRPGAALGFRYRSRMDAARSGETNAPGCTLFARAMFGESSPKFSDFDLTTPSEDLSLSMKQKPQKEFGEGEQIAVVQSKSVPIG